MKRKLIPALLLLVGNIPTLSAAPLFKNFTHPKAISHKVQSNNPSTSYTDFTGTWLSNKCMGHEMKITIENTAHYIDIDGESIVIGSMSTTSNSGIKNYISTSAMSTINSVEWAKDKTQLMFKTVNIEKAFADDDAPDRALDTAMHLSMDYITMKLTNGRLILHMNTAEYIDLQRVDSAKPTCIFNKVEA